ncbi:LytR family transcriptional regulator [Modestobacter sp. I12A-02628]|uniref:LytR family transcriptional regulator n=1 Tax=Goekera deserti TaxID=2497753 RepID=A0A7K3W8X5_9ACTN|nr:LCP family protein [Goekera deserti]MPR00423.1 LytR family transcriptional regulator [Goekera deserti]NDI49180.1 LytR family transcriptional regulator [Goekera deserti]NEL52918.1 LytR family transcriptional regulator [Goekera deserti]
MPVPPIPGPDALIPHDLDDEPGASPGRRGSSAAPQRAPRVVSPLRRRLHRVGAVLVAVLLLVSGYYVGLYVYVDRSLQRVDALSVDGPEVLAPQLQADDRTYLVVGTGLPDREGVASVSTVLVHVSDGGEDAVLVSFPSAALVDTPSCRSTDGSLREPTTEAFAQALLSGGPSCLVRSVQQVSGVRVDHYVGVDLAEVPGLVDVLGGVSVCVPEAVDTTTAAAALPAGRTTMSGEDAAGWLAPGTVADEPTGQVVAEREQRLVTATLHGALTGSALADPVTLTQFLTRVDDALIVDRDTTLADVRALGSTLGGLSAQHVQRLGLPVEQTGYVPPPSALIGAPPAATPAVPAAAPLPGDPAAAAPAAASYVLLDQTAARALFDAVIESGRVTDTLAAAVSGAAPPADPAATTPGTTDAAAPTGTAASGTTCS